MGTPTALLANSLSTGLYGMGPRAAFAWAACHPEVEGISIELEGDSLMALLTSSVESRVQILASELRVEVVLRQQELAEKMTETPSTGQSRISAAVNPRER